MSGNRDSPETKVKSFARRLASWALVLLFAGVAAENLGAQDPGYLLWDFTGGFAGFGMGAFNVDGSNGYNLLPNRFATPPGGFSGSCSLAGFNPDGSFLAGHLPSSPRDGSLIAFEGISERFDHVFVMNRDGSGVRQVTFPDPDPRFSGTDDFSAVISPDGARIAFLSTGRTERRSSQIFTVNVDGSNLQQITPEACDGDCTGVFAVAWSPDSTQLAFLGHFPSINTCPFANAAAIINADGTGGAQILTCHGSIPTGNWIDSIDWSPDGTRIAFGNPPQLIRQVSPNGTELETITAAQLGGVQAGPGAFRYSPDSTRLAYANSFPGFQGLSFINADGTGRQDAINDGNPHRIWWQPGPAILTPTTLTLGPDSMVVGPRFAQQLSSVLKDSAGNILSRAANGYCASAAPSSVISNEIGLVSFFGNPGTVSQMIVRNGGLASNTITALAQLTNPPVSFRPATWDFGNQSVITTSGTQVFTLTNTGSAVLNINAITLVGDNAADFSFDSVVTTCPLDGGPVAAGGSCDIGLAFSPLDLGPRIAQINVDDDATSSPQIIPLAGTGTMPAAAARLRSALR